MYTVTIDGITAHNPAQDDANIALFGAVVKKSTNSADSFSFTIYPQNPAYSEIKKMVSRVTVKKDDEILFHGRVLSEQTGWNNEKQIICEGDLSLFNDTIQEPYDYTGSVLGLVQLFVNRHNAQTTADKQFTIRNVTVTDPNDIVVRSNSDYSCTMKEMLDKLPGSSLGGYLMAEYDAGEDKIFLDYLADSTDGTSQAVKLSENLLDFARTSNSDGLMTALIPLGAKDETTGERLTIESVNQGKKYIVNDTAAARYGLIYGTQIWDDVTVASNLLTKAQAALADLSSIIDTITVKAIDLSLSEPEIESLGFFQYVTLIDPVHDASGQFLIAERTYNLSAPENDTLTFGGKLPSISSATTSALKQGDTILNETSEMIEYMTSIITGSKGGYKVDVLGPDGLPEKTLYMDTPDVATARQVLQINKDGIGFSSTGVNGPYTTAWTIGGYFNADFIKAGILTAIEIDNGNGTFHVTPNGALTASSGSIGGWGITNDSIEKTIYYRAGDAYYRVKLQSPSGIRDIITCEERASSESEFSPLFGLNPTGMLTIYKSDGTRTSFTGDMMSTRSASGDIKFILTEDSGATWYDNNGRQAVEIIADNEFSQYINRMIILHRKDDGSMFMRLGEGGLIFYDRNGNVTKSYPAT